MLVCLKFYTIDLLVKVDMNSNESNKNGNFLCTIGRRVYCGHLFTCHVDHED